MEARRENLDVARGAGPLEGAPWVWPTSAIERLVNGVRAGADLTPASWPDGNRVAVALSFDVDQETIPLIALDHSVGGLSAGEYGSRVGMPRILALLEEFGVTATFFVPGVSAVLHPADIRACTEAGMEVALHGWIHERSEQLPDGTESELLRRAFDTVGEIAGQAPVGYRAPSANVTLSTLEAIADLRLQYDSSLMSDDDPYELLSDGRRTGIVEIPMNWARDDAAYFRFDREVALRPYLRPRAWLEILVDEFQAAHASGGLFSLVCHPHIIGHRSRMVVLRELLELISAYDDVWVATHAQIASSCAVERASTSASHMADPVPAPSEGSSPRV